MIILYVTLGVVFGGIILFFLHGWYQRRLQESRERLDRYWQHSWGTPSHVGLFADAVHYLNRTHGSLNSAHTAEWVLSQNLGAVFGERKVRRLLELAKAKEGAMDLDWQMHFYFFHHSGIREWAKKVGVAPAFDKWVGESLDHLESNRAADLASTAEPEATGQDGSATT